ncbi:MAG: sigma-70 family RNA polymerase sigma factor, partial [Verrucomicrobiaceae bacterium]
MQDSDGHLLSRFAAHHDEAAFRELTVRYLGLIYHVALRRTGSRQMAEEVSQNVLCAVVRKAARLAKHPDRLPAWLHRAALFESSKAMRAEASHQRRKQLVHPDDITSTTGGETNVWTATLPMLDLALDRLSDSDRNLILAHYYEEKSFSQIGGQTARPASTVQKQCRRALEKLARVLRGRGVTLSVTALASGLASQSAKAAPATLLKSAAGQALASASTYSTTSLTLFMATKSKTALTIVLLVLLSPLALQELAISSAVARNEQLRAHHPPLGPEASRAPDRTGLRTASTVQRKITLELLHRTLKESARHGDNRVELTNMIATLGPEELESMIPRALSFIQGEKSGIARFLIPALAKFDPERAVRAACEPELTDFSQAAVVRQALSEWASASPDEAIEWLKD